MRIGIHFPHEATRNFIGGNALLRNSVNLHPIARAQQQRFGATGLAHDRFSRCAALRTARALPRSLCDGSNRCRKDSWKRMHLRGERNSPKKRQRSAKTDDA